MISSATCASLARLQVQLLLTLGGWGTADLLTCPLRQLRWRSLRRGLESWPGAQASASSGVKGRSARCARHSAC